MSVIHWEMENNATNVVSVQPDFAKQTNQAMSASLSVPTYLCGMYAGPSLPTFHCLHFELSTASCRLKI